MGKRLDGRPRRRGWVALFVAITLVILTVGYAYYTHETERVRRQKYDEITAIAKLKAGHIQQWRKGLLADVRALSTRPFWKRALNEWIREPNNDALLTGLRDRLVVGQQQGGYADALLLDLDGNVIVSASGQPESINAIAKKAIEEAVASGSPVLSDMYHNSHGAILMDAIAPILDPNGRSIAVGLYRTNPESILFPLIQTWPTPSQTAETLLVRRDGDDVLFLNDLRHRANTALSLRESLMHNDLPAAQAASGKKGLFHGNDYRGVDVLADLRPIPDSPWFMVAKVDTSEILAEANYRGAVVIIFSGLCILLTAGFSAYGYRHRQARLYQDLYKSEREQRKAEELFRTTLYSIGDAVITTDAGGLVQQMNPVAERLTGWLEAEATGKSLDEVFHIVEEESRTPVKNPVQRVLTEGVVVGLANHTVLISRDGTERPIADSGAPIRSEDGSVLGVVLVFRDQTEEKAAAEFLKESEATLRTVLQAAPIGIGLVTNRIFGWTNEPLSQMTGYSAADLLGQSARVIYESDEEFDRVGTVKYGQIKAGGAGSVETRWKCKDGSVIDILLSSSAIVPGELSRGVVFSAIDITERRRAEQALRESEERYRIVADFTYHWEYWVDGKGNFLYVSPSCERITGYSAEEFIGDPDLMHRIIHPDDRTEMLDHFHNVRKVVPLAVDTMDFRIIRRDGETRWIGHACQPVYGQEGQPFGRRVSNRDITERKTLEAQLLQSQKMEAIGTLAGGIAHDFNNLLQAVMGYTELLMGGKKQGDPELDHLQKINNSGKRGADLVKGLMMFSRKVQPEFRPVDLNHEIVQVQKLLSHTIPKTIKIDLRLSGELETVQADPSQMGQVLMNLGVNARDAMPDGGTLTIETANLELDKDYCAVHLEVMPGPYVLLTVSDSGHGMEKETLSHIFDPFFTTKEVGKGTGLGLATAYGIVKQHGGHITCYSEPGLGTTFKIYLPAIQTEKTSETQTEDVPIQRGTETILLVDDEEFLRELGTRLLNQYGYHVITASNGKEALEIYQREGESISLIILDLIMPEMDGKQCLGEILRIDPNAKVIIASGYSESGPANGAMAVGAKGFVQKPYNMRQLLNTIREILDGN